MSYFSFFPNIPPADNKVIIIYATSGLALAAAALGSYYEEYDNTIIGSFAAGAIACGVKLASELLGDICTNPWSMDD